MRKTVFVCDRCGGVLSTLIRKAPKPTARVKVENLPDAKHTKKRGRPARKKDEGED